MRSPRRLPDLLRVRAAAAPDAVAHDDTTTTMTFGEWDRRVDGAAGGLAAAGVAAGDRVLLPITNRHAADFAVAYLAAQRAGAIAVPLNTRLTAEEIHQFADLVQARWAVTDVPAGLTGLPLARCWSVADLPADPAALPDQDALDADADADIISTSGTTGRPKGVVFSHRDFLERMGDGTRTSPSRRLLHALPFTGFGGCHGLMLASLQFGSTVITQPVFDPAGFVELVARRRPDTLHLVPSMLRLILDLPDIDAHPFEGVRWIITGTAPVPVDTTRRTAARWPHVRVVNTYGMTESSVSVATRSQASALKPGSVGRPEQPGAVQIRDAAGGLLPAGQPGEVWTRAAHPRRYWNDPAASADAWSDGWLRTGDLGLIDADGDLVLTGRSKELIIRGGYNIGPVEVEDVLLQYPDVAEAAVVGVPHEVLGEDVAAAVVATSGAMLDPAALLAWCRERLATNKVPRTLLVVDALPYNQNGKVVKRALLPTLTAAAVRQRAERAAGGAAR